MSSSVPKGSLSLAVACLCALAFTATVARAQKVVKTVQLENSPNGIGVDPIARRAYVAVGSEVEVIGEASGKVLRTFNLPTDWAITDVKPNSLTGRIYVATEGGGLWVVDPKTYLPTDLINVEAVGLSVDSLTNKIYVSDFNSTLYVVDGKTNTIDKMITVSAIENVVVNPITNRIYAAQDLFPGQVTVVDGKTNKVVAHAVGGGYLSFAVAVDPVLNRFYSTDQFGTLSAFDGATNKLIATVTLPGQPAGVSVDLVKHQVYVSDYQNNTIDLVNGLTNKLTKSIAVGSSPSYSDIDPIRGFFFVGNTGASAGYTASSETVSILKGR